MKFDFDGSDEERVPSGEKDAFKINHAFKSKFEYTSRRNMLAQGKLKYGDILAADDAHPSDESSSEIEDSEGDYVNPKFERRYLEVITAIRNGDKSIL